MSALFEKSVIAAALCVSLLAPAAAATNPLSENFASLLKDIPAISVNSEPREIAMKALALIGKDRIEEASKLFNSALQLEPSNSYLQFFNAFTYHLAGQRGDTQKLTLAEQGYLQAIQFDRSNWLAHYFLGSLYFEQRNFQGAQQEWAEVLLSRHDDSEVLLRLVAASYFAGDPVTAAACLGRLRVLRPTDAQTLRLSAIVSAAIGQGQEAIEWLSQYEATKPAARDAAFVRERVSHWAEVHRGGQKQAQPLALNGAVSAAPRRILTQGTAETGAVQTPAQAAESGEQQVPVPTVAGGQPASNNMVLVDVVIIQTEDSIGTRRGVNLLNALSLQFGVQATRGYTNSQKRTSDPATDAVGVLASAISHETSITRAISIPALIYSLNIANAHSNLNEVLARPTLAALDGMGSEFFSGSAIDAAVVASGSTGGSSVAIAKEIGVKLNIVPQFLDGNKVRLMVNAQRTFLKRPSQDVFFTYKLEVSKVQVNANVVMDFGETLILGGLTEKETSNARDGVTFLQDVPIVQYAFSQRDTSNFQRSVLMLVTPRRPQYTFRNERAARAASTGADADGGTGESMRELRARYGDWFKPYPNLASVFGQLNHSSLYREFRTGDVTLERWDKQDTTLDRLKSALDFLFY